MILSSKLRKINCLINIFFVSFAFFSCVNEDSQLGLDLVKTSGGMDVLHSNENIVSVKTVTFKMDSLVTVQNDNYVLGSYADTQFGKIKTSIYTSLGLEDYSGYDFTSIGTIDSAVLCLAYSSQGAFVSDSSIHSDNMNVSVYMLSSNIDSTDKYGCSDIATQSEAIFSSTIFSDPLHGVKIEGQDKETIPHIRLSLNSNFINKLKQGKYETQQLFAQDFKGIKITAQSSTDSYLAYVNMKSDFSGIFVYYHDHNGNAGRYIINFTGNGYRFMRIEKDYSSSSLSGLNSVAPNDSIKTQNYIYLASLGIAESRLDLNGLDNWYNQDSIKGAALNRAELILPVSELSTKAYIFPRSINVFRKQDGKYYYINDQTSVNNWLGNKYDASINAYRIDVTSFLQNYLLGKYDKCELYLVPDNRISSASRVVLTGPTHSNPPKLNIIYSHPAQD
ncbi:MAG: DUF4270 family protein [Bacteroidales bacterium]